MFAEVIVPFRWVSVRLYHRNQYLVLTDEDAYALNVAQGLDHFLSKARPGFFNWKRHSHRPRPRGNHPTSSLLQRLFSIQDAQQRTVLAVL